MLRSSIPVFFLMMAWVFTACDDDDFVSSPHGFEYRLHQKPPATKVQWGDYVLYHADYADARTGNVFFTTRTAPRPNLRALTDIESGTVLEKAIALMGEGDSITVLLGADRIQRRIFPPHVVIPELIHLHVKVYRVYTPQQRETAYRSWYRHPVPVVELPGGLAKKIIHSDTSAPRIRPGDEITYGIDAIHLLPDEEIIYQHWNRHTSVIPEVIPGSATPVLHTLLTMHAGDSVHLKVVADSVQFPMPHTWPGDRIVYRIKVYTHTSLEERLMAMSMQEQEIRDIRSEAYNLLQQAVCDWVEGSWAGDTLLEGMHVQMLRKDEKSTLPANETRAVVHYMGFTDECVLFAESFEKIEPLQFEPGQGFVIRGWDLLMRHMQPGDHWLIRIPPHLAFGAGGLEGKVGPRADVWYYMWRIE